MTTSCRERVHYSGDGQEKAMAVDASVASSALSTQSASPGQKKQLLTLNVVGPRSSEQHEKSP